MTDTDGVLEAIDACLNDWSVSEDAMRWAPERKPLTYVEILRRAATQDADTADPVSVTFDCNVESSYDGQRCTWHADLLRIAECGDHGPFITWLCSPHAYLAPWDMLCKVCGEPMSEPVGEVENLEALLIETLASVGGTPRERDELRELYETYLHQIVPARLRRHVPAPDWGGKAAREALTGP